VQKLFAAMQAQLDAFIKQRDRIAMVIACADGDVPLYLKTLEAIEQADSPHAFWLFAQPFTTPEAYVDALVNTVRARVQQLATLIAQADEPMPTPAPFPEERLGPEHPAVVRLRELVTYTRAVHDDAGSLVVWGFFPVTVADGAVYARFMGALLEHSWPAPWCHHARLFVREARADARMTTHFRKLPRLSFYDLDLSSSALEQSLVEQAMDDGCLPVMRMQALLMLANLDLANQRLQKAVDKFQVLATFYRNTQQPALFALAINGMGEVCARGGAVKQAQSLFESALTPAIDAQADGLAVLINIALNLGNLHLTQQRFAESIGYFQAVAEMAGVLCNAQLKIQCLETMGACHSALGEHKRAWERWREGLALARGLEVDLQQERLLQRLRDLYRALHMTDDLCRTEAELRVLRERGPAALKPLAHGARHA
jgi:hypothetical protein